MKAAGLDCRRDPADLDEAAIRDRLKARGAVVAARALAKAKAEAVSKRRPGATVIGADQILVLGVTMFEKPKTKARAAADLRRLSGRSHRLISAVAVARDGRALWSRVATAKLTMRTMSRAEIAAYLDAAGPDVLGSVGAYQVEGLGIRLFEKIDGDYFTVLGLPLLPLLGYLRRAGLG